MSWSRTLFGLCYLTLILPAFSTVTPQSLVANASTVHASEAFTNVTNVPVVSSSAAVIVNVTSTVGFDVTDETVIELPCWYNSINRTGRLEIKRGDLTNGPLYIQTKTCSGSSMFDSFYDRPRMSDALYIDVRAVDLKLGEVLRFYSARRQIREDTTLPFSSLTSNLTTELTSGRAFHAHLVTPSSDFVWPRSPQLKIEWNSAEVSSTTATNNVTAPQKLDPEDVVAVVNYVVTYRAADAQSAYDTASFFRYSKTMKYCWSLGSFVPDSACGFIPANSTNLTLCPQKSFEEYSIPVNATLGECSHTSIAMYDLEPHIIKTTTRRPMMTTTWWPNTTPYYPYYGSDVTYYRNVGLGVGGGFAIISLCCALLRYCSASHVRREQNARHAQAVAVVNTSSIHPSPSGDNVRVFGATHAFGNPEGQNGIANQNFIGAPPSYDQIFKPFGVPEESADTPQPTGQGRAVPRPPILVVPQPSVTSGSTHS